MKDSIIFKHLLNSHFLCIDESEYTSNFSENIHKQKEKLKAILDETQMKEVNHYRFDLIRHMFHIRDIESFKMFYLDIKLGMEVADFCAKELEEE